MHLLALSKESLKKNIEIVNRNDKYFLIFSGYLKNLCLHFYGCKN